MRKLIAVVLVILLLLPAAALAADPIVGCWYVHMDLKTYPELRATYGNYDTIVDLYFFDESGVIRAIEGVITDGACTPTFGGVGKWEKNLFGYNVSLLGFGDSTMTVSGDEAKMKLSNSGMDLTMKFRRLVVFDIYNDYEF